MFKSSYYCWSSVYVKGVLKLKSSSNGSTINNKIQSKDEIKSARFQMKYESNYIVPLYSSGFILAFLKFSFTTRIQCAISNNALSRYLYFSNDSLCPLSEKNFLNQNTIFDRFTGIYRVLIFWFSEKQNISQLFTTF